MSSPGKFVGRRIPRREDPRFLRGEGRYVDDFQPPGLTYAAVLRSPHAHAWLRRIETEQALRLPGVLKVITFEEIARLAKPIPMRLQPHPSFARHLQMPLANGKVRYVGEPVAVVLASSRYVAEDALELIGVEYEPLEAVVDVRSALAAGAVLIREDAETNLAGSRAMQVGDVEAAFQKAGLTFEERFSIQRHTGSPMEPRGLVAQYDRGSKTLTVWGPTKVPHFNRSILASMLDLPEHKIHFIEPDVGGGFGVRGEFYPEDFLIPFLAISAGRPVKWIEDRREHFLAANHSREQLWDVKVAAERDGTLAAVKATIWNDMGAYIRTHGATVPSLSAALFPGPYKLRNYWCEWNAVITNKTPTGTYRAPGRYECNFVRERLIDLISHRLDLDPLAVRLRNFVQPQEMPYAVGTDVLHTAITYDSGDYPRLMKKAIEITDYDGLRKEQAGRQTGEKRLGIGFACFVEKTGTGPFEAATVRIDRSGKTVIYTGAASLGQGVETILSQICADELGVDMADVTVIHGDTFLAPNGAGTFASRTAVMAGNSVLLAARAVKQKVLQMAANYLGCDPGAVRLENATISADGLKETLPLRDLVWRVSGAWESAVSGLDLEAHEYFECREMAYPHGVQAALVEVDAGTGMVEVKKIWSLFDVGRAINPMLLEGQILGGVVQGLGGAFLEELAYGDDGQLLSASFMDYLLPSSMEAPPIEVHIFENDPTPLNPLGVKGGGEGGTAAVGGAIANAVSDALRPLGVEITTLPLNPARLLDLITGATKG